MKKYHLWTEGCQMNVADSQRVASALEGLGYGATRQPAEADVIILNTCVVRQSAEDKAVGRLTSLRPLKDGNPDLVINLMGCMVGVKGAEKLRAQFPYVDVFSPPSDPGPLVSYITQVETRILAGDDLAMRNAQLDGDLILPLHERGRLVSAHVPVVYGCSHACTFCIIPYRRGVERSRPVGEITAEVRSLVQQGVKEITLLGQIVDRYGCDIPDGPRLSDLLHVLHPIDGLERLRFLTSHPNWMTDDLLDAVADLPKVMPHIEVPVQAGDDEVLANMQRGYTRDDYYNLIDRIRGRIPAVSIGTDIIVGFPGETDVQFQKTHDLLADLKLDVAHLARYSERPGTVAARRLPDDVPEETKWERFRALEALQEDIVAGINSRFLGEQLEILVEDKVRGRWRGRTPNNKLVFIEADGYGRSAAEGHEEVSPLPLRGRLVEPVITWTGPWSMQGRVL
ncbi:MAG TPA: tRNA (N6-isopentenyl adenosine(37)-C2)-methylthiotransferase MiaB [Anaerolineales bacterium]|nr:tRNA (N6-isopentenyl adenosine(37)-C2)-methylthiotransferase MiaB [Anaerolineales bacterium]